MTQTQFDIKLFRFHVFRSDRQENRKGGGVFIFVRDGIEAVEAELNCCLCKDSEQIWISIKLQYESPLLAGCVYRAPLQNVSTETNKLTDRSLSQVIRLSQTVN